MDIVFEVLKWVFIVLLAGFIGQFGRTMSHSVMDYLKKRREKRTKTAFTETRETTNTTTESQVISTVKKEAIPPSTQGQGKKPQSKIEKKALKARLKAKKKSEKEKRGK